MTSKEVCVRLPAPTQGMSRTKTRPAPPAYAGDIQLLLLACYLLLWLALGLPAANAQALTGGPGPTPAARPLRPPGTPDVHILSFAGAFTGIGPISSTGGTVQSGIQLLPTSFEIMGYTTTVHEYAAAVGDSHTSPFFGTQEHGIERAIKDLDEIKARQIEGFANPTHLVLVGDSGGGAPMHLIPFLFPELQFDYMIDADTACMLMTAQFLLWEALTPPSKQSYLRQRLHQLPRKELTWLLGTPLPCAISPGHPHPINNLVANNVVYNLDIRTALVSSRRSPGPVPFVGIFLPIFFGRNGPDVPMVTSLPLGLPRNVRPRSEETDPGNGRPRHGDAAGIYRYVDTSVFHGDFSATADGARWAAGKVLELGLPLSPKGDS